MGHTFLMTVSVPPGMVPGGRDLLLLEMARFPLLPRRWRPQ